MRDKLINAATSLMVVCAVVSTAFTVRRTIGEPTSTPTDIAPRTQEDWSKYATGEHVFGPASAPVTIVEFADFQCPFCRRLKASLDSLRAEHPADVKIIFRQFPLPNHEFATRAARASECAGEQGRFEAMHDALYQNQDSIGLAPWSWFAALAGVPNHESFELCLRRSQPFSALLADAAAGRELSVTGTPTVLINQLRLEGAVPLDSLEAYVKRAKTMARTTSKQR
jgi:protein-disulfide isomerase